MDASPSIQPEPGGADRTLAAGLGRSLWRSGWGLLAAAAADHLLDIVRGLETVGRRLEPRHRGRRSGQIWRHDDDEFSLVSLELLRAEQLPEDRDVAEPRNLGDRLLVDVLQ